MSWMRSLKVLKSKFWGFMKDMVAWTIPEEQMATTLPASMG